MGERLRAFDWSAHPLGLPQHWPQALQMATSLCLNAGFPTAIYWGPDLHLLYNDAWSEIPADKHPGVLGKPAREAWPDIWDIVGPQFAHVLATGEGLALYDQMLPMVRGGRARETWWNYSFTAIRNADHSIGGIFNQGNDITAVVLARRERQAELERLRELFKQAPAPVARLRGPDHVVEFANDAYLRLVGRTDIAGKPVRDALPEVVEQGFVKLLDSVYREGKAYVASSASIRLRSAPDGTTQESLIDFIYQPVRDAAGDVEGIFVLATDVTERARAESALRLTNWQLGEERARLAAMIEAEQRAQQALRRFADTLEAAVKQRTLELTRALEKQNAVADRLRAAFDTSLLFQGYLDTAGTVLDANPTSLAAIGCALHEVVGRPFWDTPWFARTPGLQDVVRAAVETARAGTPLRRPLWVELPAGRRRFDFSLRPVFDAKRVVVGLVPEAVDITDRIGPAPAA